VLQKLQYGFSEVELKLGMYDAPQRNNCLNVSSSLRLPLERHNSQRHVTSRALGSGRSKTFRLNPSYEGSSGIVYHAVSLCTRTQPLHAIRILSLVNTRTRTLDFLLDSESHSSRLTPSRQPFVFNCHACALVLLLNSDNRFV